MLPLTCFSVVVFSFFSLILKFLAVGFRYDKSFITKSWTLILMLPSITPIYHNTERSWAYLNFYRTFDKVTNLALYSFHGTVGIIPHYKSQYDIKQLGASVITPKWPEKWLSSRNHWWAKGSASARPLVTRGGSREHNCWPNTAPLLFWVVDIGVLNMLSEKLRDDTDTGN